MDPHICLQCGKPFEVGPGSRAKYCGSTCRARRSEGKPAAGPKPRAKRADYRIRDQVRVELKEHGREGTSLGLIALDLASQLAQSNLPPATRGGLAKELRSTLVAALEGARRKTGVDELKERRNGKRNSARSSAG